MKQEGRNRPGGRAQGADSAGVRGGFGVQKAIPEPDFGTSQSRKRTLVLNSTNDMSALYLVTGNLKLITTPDFMISPGERKHRKAQRTAKDSLAAGIWGGKYF